VYLPSVVAYNHPSDMPDVSSLPVLSNDGVLTFGSFNQPKKLSTKTLKLWARVMQAVPNSRLVLRHAGLDQTYCETRVRDHFEEEGIGPDRLHLFGGSPHYHHVSAFQDLDIQLDSTPASGGMTTLEGCFMSVPCLTLAGDRTAARISASIMTTLGYPDWVAKDEDEYVAKAVRFSSDLEGLAKIRAGLRERLKASIICSPEYVRHVESAYRRLWRRWCERRAEVAA
jgi:predicted O-linked N-acetylglucosamine transferase (SPINDLY family)